MWILLRSGVVVFISRNFQRDWSSTTKVPNRINQSKPVFHFLSEDVLNISEKSGGVGRGLCVLSRMDEPQLQSVSILFLLLPCTFPPFHVLSGYLYVLLNLVAVSTVWILINFVKIIGLSTSCSRNFVATSRISSNFIYSEQFLQLSSNSEISEQFLFLNWPFFHTSQCFSRQIMNFLWRSQTLPPLG